MKLLHKPVDPTKALAILAAGNRRYVRNRTTGPRRSAARRRAIAAHQDPFAIVVGCADSRVPPELIFDQGFGDLFVVRTAGHVVDQSVLGSIEYGVAELNIPLIMVLGHDRCGAIIAASAPFASDHHGSTGHLIKALLPAIRVARRRGGDQVSHAVDANVAHTVHKVRKLPPVRRAMRAGRLLVIGARYSLESGQIGLLKV